MNPCRCGDSYDDHYPHAEHPCSICGCPEYRPAETVDTLTLKGITR